MFHVLTYLNCGNTLYKVNARGAPSRFVVDVGSTPGVPVLGVLEPPGQHEHHGSLKQVPLRTDPVLLALAVQTLAVETRVAF